MKHARKLEYDRIKTPSSMSQEKNSESILNALNSLVTSTEFSRDQFGSNAESITHMDNEMNAILQRSDIEPSLKLILYNQLLRKYLLLQRMSEKKGGTTQSSTVQLAPVQPAPVQSAPVQPAPVQLVQPPSVQQVPEPSPIRLEDRVLRTPEPRNRFQRTTPKQDILRKSGEKRHNKRYDNYFVNWKGI